MPNNKSRGNDGLFKEFCENFWEDMKAVFINSLKQAKMNVSLSISQRQVVIKVLEKKDRGKWFIKNWKPSLLLNVAIKTLSESFATKPKSIYHLFLLAIYYLFKPNCVCWKQGIKQSGKLIFDIIEICGKKISHWKRCTPRWYQHIVLLLLWEFLLLK